MLKLMVSLLSVAGDARCLLESSADNRLHSHFRTYDLPERDLVHDRTIETLIGVLISGSSAQVSLIAFRPGTTSALLLPTDAILIQDNVVAFKTCD